MNAKSKLLNSLLKVFKKDGYDYFVDMMPALHNYVTVDTPAFLSNTNYISAIFEMCKSVNITDSLRKHQSLKIILFLF